MDKERIKNVVLTALLIILSVCIGVLYFDTSYERIWEGIKDIWSSLQYFFITLFRIDKEIEPSVLKPSIAHESILRIPGGMNGFFSMVGDYFNLLFTKDNFTKWIDVVGGKSIHMLFLLLMVIPTIVVVTLIIKLIYSFGNTDHNKDTIPLKIYKKSVGVFVFWIKSIILRAKELIETNDYLKYTLLLIWLLNFNILILLFEFIAYYFYFVLSFELSTLGGQFYKLLVDLRAITVFVPMWLLFILTYIYLFRVRKRIAKQKLRHMEARNCGFIKELPIVTLTCGSMGKKKTTVISDMALSQEVMFRQKCFELLQKNDMRFPFFPWICFEMELKKCLEHGTVHNLATIKDWVDLKRERFERNGDIHKQLYGYDISKYGRTYDDGLRYWDIFDILKTYAQLYYIYIIESSLIVANYSIREDNFLHSEGNFPVWVTDFFPEHTSNGGRHAHIVDYDALRLGKKLIEDNPNVGSFEFGILVLSEIGKERGNNLELREVKKNKDETNQKNDLFNSWLKMCRHNATVDNFPFIKVFADEQRPESWGADARELCDVLNIADSGPQRIALPFYIYEEMAVDLLYSWFINLFYAIRVKRGDNTLFTYLCKSIVSALFKYNSRNYNKYGYSTLFIEKERGTLDNKIEKKRYFLMNKKIYSLRFSTDCFSDYFNDLGRKTKVGLDDYFEYAGERATVDELKMQNSFFINSLYPDNNT